MTPEDLKPPVEGPRRGTPWMALFALLGIVGACALCAVPTFFAERGRTKKAKADIAALATAEQRYYATNKTWVFIAPGADEQSMAFVQLDFSPSLKGWMTYAVVADGERDARVIGTGHLGDDGPATIFTVKLMPGLSGPVESERAPK